MATPDDPQQLDGNAIAGLLSEILAVDATTVLRTCASCGEQHAMAEHLMYRGAGVVLRCPGCGDIALTVAVSERHVATRMHGVFRVERPA